MRGFGASHCPLCRAEFKHFAAICKPLHVYLNARFPEAVAERDAQTKEQERDEWKAESPEIALPDGDVLNGFKCCGCHEVAAPPAVLSCGHVVCARAAGGWAAGCPVDGCVGGAADSSLAVCGVIDDLLRAEWPGYDAACARPCSATTPHGAPKPSSTNATPAVAEASAAASASDASRIDEPASLVAQPVEVHSLSSAAGQALNGLRGNVELYDAEGGRCVVLVHSGHHAKRVRVRPANLRRITFPYVHFGVGCDGCGVFPIEGRRFRCADCSEAIGFDLCGACHDKGMHLRSDSGRFNQQHRPEHAMEETPEEDTVLHQLQRAHPELSVNEIMQRVQAHESAQGEEEE